MSLLRSQILASALAGLLVAATFVNDVFWTPLTAAIAFLLPDFSVDPRESVALDVLAREAMPGETIFLTKAKAWLNRVLRHERWTAGGFALSDTLSPA